MTGAPATLTGVILAGGGSRRMGEDKSFVTLDGEQLVERVVGAIGAVAEELLIVTNTTDTYVNLGARLVQDVYPGAGPLGGIYAGLAAAESECCLVVGCDMPFLNPDLLRYLAELAHDHDAVLPYLGPTMPQPGGHGTAKARDMHPLHAAYRRNCLAAIRRAIGRHDLRTISFLAEVDVRFVSRQEVERFDPRHLSFFNVNTPADLVRARRLVASSV
jgi:molybdopterin-guanine dinucleotide biosynthesis protein A